MSTEFYITIGYNLRAIRRSFCLSQTQLGSHLDVSFQQVQKYEKGLNRIPLHHFYKLKNVFDIPFDDFFTGMGNPDYLNAKSEKFHNQEEALIRKFQSIQDEKLRIKILEILNILMD